MARAILSYRFIQSFISNPVLFQAFRRALNPAQVLDLSRVPPETGLRWCSLLPPGKRST